MIVTKCMIHNFGKLHQVEIEFHKGNNVIIRKNGWGKTTLMAFLRVMFYGFENETKRDTYEKERTRYLPWQGGTYGGSVEFEADGSSYILYRTFGRKGEKEDVFVLKDKETGLESRDYSKNIGEELFGIDRASFLRTAFVSENQCETFLTDGMNTKIGNLSEKTEDANHYEEADEMLKNKINQLSCERKTGELYKRKQEIHQLEFELQQIERTHQQVEELEQQQQSCLETKEQLRKKRDTYEQLQMELIDSMEEDDQETEREYEYKKMQQTKEQQKEIRYIYNIRNVLVIVLLLMIAGIAFWIKNETVAISMIVCSVIYFYVILTKQQAGKIKRTEYERPNPVTSRPTRTTHMTDVRRDKLKSITRNIQSCTKDMETVEHDLKLLEKRLTQLYEASAKKQELEKRLQTAKDDYAEKQQKYHIFVETRKLLQQAKNQYTSRYLQPVLYEFQKYCRKILQEDKQFQIDANGTIYIEEEGIPRESKFFSRGYKDLLGVCYRLAFVKVMYRKQAPFLMFDDPFVHLDDENYRYALQMLEEVAQEYQMIYLSCRDV